MKKKKDLKGDLDVVVSEICDRYDIWPVDLCKLCMVTKLRRKWAGKSDSDE